MATLAKGDAASGKVTGMGEVKASAVLARRQSHFSSLQELKGEGVTVNLISKLKDAGWRICPVAGAAQVRHILLPAPSLIWSLVVVAAAAAGSCDMDHERRTWRTCF